MSATPVPILKSFEVTLEVTCSVRTSVCAECFEEAERMAREKILRNPIRPESIFTGEVIEAEEGDDRVTPDAVWDLHGGGHHCLFTGRDGERWFPAVGAPLHWWTDGQNAAAFAGEPPAWAILKRLTPLPWLALQGVLDGWAISLPAEVTSESRGTNFGVVRRLVAGERSSVWVAERRLALLTAGNRQPVIMVSRAGNPRVTIAGALSPGGVLVAIVGTVEVKAEEVQGR